MTDVVRLINSKAYSAFTEPSGQPNVKFIAAPPDEINNYTPFETISGTYTDGTPGSSCTGL